MSVLLSAEEDYREYGANNHNDSSHHLIDRSIDHGQGDKHEGRTAKVTSRRDCKEKRVAVLFELLFTSLFGTGGHHQGSVTRLLGLGFHPHLLDTVDAKDSQLSCKHDKCLEIRMSE